MTDDDAFAAAPTANTASANQGAYASAFLASAKSATISFAGVLTGLCIALLWPYHILVVVFILLLFVSAMCQFLLSHRIDVLKRRAHIEENMKRFEKLKPLKEGTDQTVVLPDPRVRPESGVPRGSDMTFEFSPLTRGYVRQPKWFDISLEGCGSFKRNGMTTYRITHNLMEDRPKVRLHYTGAGETEVPAEKRYIDSRTVEVSPGYYSRHNKWIDYPVTNLTVEIWV